MTGDPWILSIKYVGTADVPLKPIHKEWVLAKMEAPWRQVLRQALMSSYVAKDPGTAEWVIDFMLVQTEESHARSDPFFRIGFFWLQGDEPLRIPQDIEWHALILILCSSHDLHHTGL